MQFLIALIGLGVAIDYALIIVVRWREEIARGAEGDEAIVRAMGTAGRAVVFSGHDGRRSACSRSSCCRCRSCARSASAGC